MGLAAAWTAVAEIAVALVLFGLARRPAAGGVAVAAEVAAWAAAEPAAEAAAADGFQTLAQKRLAEKAGRPGLWLKRPHQFPLLTSHFSKAKIWKHRLAVRPVWPF